jgi:HEAT repeat protein
MARTQSAFAGRVAALDAAGDTIARDALVLEGFRDADPAVREVAIAWGARVLEPGTLVTHLAEEADATLRNAALAALERQGPYAHDAVARLAASPDPDTAMFACQVLGRIGGPESEEALLAAVQRPEVNVVQAATEALGVAGTARAIPTLVRLLGREPWLQLAALDALGSIGSAEAVPALLALVPGSFMTGPALEALVRIGAPSAMDRLVSLLLDPANDALRPALVRAIGAALDRAEVWHDLPDVRAAVAAPGDPTGLRRCLTDMLSAPPDGAGSPADDRSTGRGGSALTRAAGALAVAAELPDMMVLVLLWGAERDGRRWILPLATRRPGPFMGQLAGLLRHPDPVVRAVALEAVPPAACGRARLVAALGDGSPQVRIAACQALGGLADPATLPALMGHLQSADIEERTAAAHAIARFPAEVLAPALGPALASADDEMIQAGALAVLAVQAVPDLDEAVWRLATSSSGPVRRAALRAAAHRPGSRAEVLLLRALADRDQAVQMDALEHLVSRGGDRVGATLLALLGTGDSLRYHVIRALGRLGLPAAAAPLESLFPGAALHEQIEIVTALSRIGTDGARGFLLECLHHPELEIRRVAAQGLAALVRPGDLALVKDLATDPDWVLRTEAARALGRLKQPEGRNTLLNLARDLEPAVARAARAALAGVA